MTVKFRLHWAFISRPLSAWIRSYSTHWCLMWWHMLSSMLKVDKHTISAWVSATSFSTCGMWFGRLHAKCYNAKLLNQWHNDKIQTKFTTLWRITSNSPVNSTRGFILFHYFIVAYTVVWWRACVCHKSAAECDVDFWPSSRASPPAGGLRGLRSQQLQPARLSPPSARRNMIALRARCKLEGGRHQPCDAMRDLDVVLCLPTM